MVAFILKSLFIADFGTLANSSTDRGTVDCSENLEERLRSFSGEDTVRYS